MSSQAPTHTLRTASPSLAASRPATAARAERPIRWKERVEEPLNHYVYYPLAHRIVRLLLPTAVTPNQVTLVQPFLAAAAGYLVAHNDWRYLVAGVLVFGFRNVLDCVDGSLARAKNMTSPTGHAIDGLCDWLSGVFLYCGIYVHLSHYPPAHGAWAAALPVGWVVSLALLQGALRSFASDYYLQKYGAILDDGRDDTAEKLRQKILVLKTRPGFFAHAEAWIAWWGHLVFEQEIFDIRRSRGLDVAEIQALSDARDEPLTRFVARLWTVSNGDFFFTLTLFTLLVGGVWEGQVFMATIGLAWIVAVVVFNAWFIRRTARRAAFVAA